MPTSSIRDLGKNNSSSAHFSEQNYQLLIIDPAVEYYQMLLAGLTPNTFVHILEKNRDGIEQITEILSSSHPSPYLGEGTGVRALAGVREQFSPLHPCPPAPLPPCPPAPLHPCPPASSPLSLHIISHGSPGTLYLGNNTLELNNLEKYRSQLEKWGIAHLYIYGCKVAAGDAGAEFLTKLHQITQAEIYANPHLTGNAAKGGNWNLKQIHPRSPAPPHPCTPAPLPLNPETLATYPGLLLEPEYQWAASFGSSSDHTSHSIAIDSSGNVYTTGDFRGTVDFDPGPGTFNLTSAGIWDTFISKLNADGSFAWAKSFENSGSNLIWSIAVDSSDNIYTTGLFQGTVDFDPGSGTFNLTGGNTFISKLNADGSFAWAKSFENGGSGYGITTDSSGNVYTTGRFYDTADFDPGPGTFNLTGGGVFISKLNADGTFAWAKSFGDNGYDLGFDIAVDSSGNVYTTGSFEGTADFDPGTGTFNLTSAGNNDIFISKLNADGTFAWAKNLGGSDGDDGASIAIDSSGNVYTTGGFSGTADFDPGAGTFNLTAAGDYDTFISKLNADGTFAWAKSFEGSGDDWGYSITVDSSGNIYTSGGFQGTADFDPGSGTFNLTAAGGYDTFISKLNADGNFAWAKSVGSSGEDWSGSIAVDDSGNIYTTGDFQGTTDFDPGSGTANLTSAGSYDAFILKLTPGIAPTVTLNSTSAPTVNGVFTVTATFSEDVTGFDISDITLGNGTASNFTIVDATTYTFDITPTASGQVTVDIADAKATDNAGNDNIAATQLTRNAALSWTKSFGGSSGEFGYSIAVDNSGNIYTTGRFYGTADFDPGAGTTNLTAAGQDDIFISKLNADGTFGWAKNLGNIWGDSGYSVAVDSSGNTYITGSFWGTVDFDPGVGTFNLTAAAKNRDTFISKLNADGTFAWAKNLGGSGSDNGKSITVDNSGNVYTTGSFQGTADFDPGVGTFNLTAAGSDDTFISKLNADGTFAWAKNLGGSGSDNGKSITVDNSGNVYTTGSFSGTADFNPDTATFNLTAAGSNDTFISKLNADGTFAWAKNLGGSGSDSGNGIAVDNSGNVYTTGSFQGTVDFNPDTATFNLTSAGSDDTFINKLDSDGNFAWAKSFGGSWGDIGNSITVDNSGKIYTTGQFQSTVDFDPGVGTFKLTSAGGNNAFISMLNADGTFAGAKSFSGSTGNMGNSIDVDTSGNIYTTGQFKGTVDFDPGVGTNNLTAAGEWDAFISKLAPESIPTVIVAPTVALSSTAAATINGPFTVTATFSEDVTGFDISDITLGNGTAGNFTIIDAKTYTFDVTPTADGNVTVNVAAAQAKNNAGTDNTAATPLTRTADITGPTVALTSPAASTVNGPFTVTATFSEDVTGFDISDITVGNGAASNFTIVDATTYTFDVTLAADGQVTVDIAAAQATDDTGNDNIAATQLTRTAVTVTNNYPAMPAEPTVNFNVVSATISGSSNNDILAGDSSANAIKGDAGNDFIQGLTGDDTIIGGVDNATVDSDIIFGDAGNDLIQGNAGNDIIAGGEDSDIAFGGQGDDQLWGDQGSDTLIGDDGNDVIFGGSSSSGGTNIDLGDAIYGGNGNDILLGNQGNDSISGGDGDDLLYGGTDDDLLHGDAGNDFLYGDTGNDILFGSVGDDTVQGDIGDDTLYGGQNNDIILGGDGSDILSGDKGDDTLTGGGGSDTFRLFAGNGTDIITDFTDGEDMIGLASGLTWANLSISATSDGFAAISAGGTTLAILNGVDVSFISSDDFMSVG